MIEYCQATNVDYVMNALLDDSIWFRLFEIYLQRSDKAKGKSMRQMLLVLTGVIQKADNSRSQEMRGRALSTFIDILCLRPDRVKVKPALQGLAHFLQKRTINISDVIRAYGKLLSLDRATTSDMHQIQMFFKMILSWIVHHDTALSAGHLARNFLAQLRQSQSLPGLSLTNHRPLWIVPVVDMLRHWPDRLQEFKTHVFPHCFLSENDEYIQFLAYLNFPRHVPAEKELPRLFIRDNNVQNELSHLEEFKIILGAISTGKELGVVKDIGESNASLQ